MAKKAGTRASGDPVIAALEEVTRSLNATTEILREVIARLPADGGVRGEASVARAGRPGPAPGEEAALRELAEKQRLDLPMERLIALRNERFPDSRPRFWAVVDFDRHSSKPRMFVFDALERSVAAYLCAHGIGSEGTSDDGMADLFSNVNGSKASSLGIYRCAETYQGANGYSLRLDGLEETNSNARSRAIVIHGADYVSDTFAAQHGRVGRSEGCPALDHRYARTVIDQLKQGSLLIHWKTP